MAEALHPYRRKPLIDMRLNIWLLKVFGLLELDTTAVWKRSLHRFYSAIVLSSYVVLLSGNMGGMVRDWGDFDAVINNICLTVAIFSSLVKFSYVVYKRQDVLLLLRSLWEFENHQWPQCLSSCCSDIITKTSRHVRAVTLVLSFSVFIVSPAWTVSPFITAGFSVTDPAGLRPHPLMSAFFFDYQSSPTYEVIYVFQTVSLFSYCLVVSSFDTVCMAFFMQVGAQFRILLESLKRLQEVAKESLARDMTYSEEDGVEPGASLPGGSADCRQEVLNSHMFQYLRTCVQHHIEIIKFVKKLDDVFNPVMLVQILYSVFDIAVTGLQATESSADFGSLIKLLALAIALFVELYLFCKYADVVLHLSQEVAMAAYSCEWYFTDPHIKTMLQIIILRAQSPAKLTAYRFRVICLDTYATLLNGAYTYFALLKEIKKGKEV